MSSKELKVSRIVFKPILFHLVPQRLSDCCVIRSERASRLANQTSADPSPRVSKSRDPSPRPSVATGKTPPLKLGDKLAQKASPTTPKPLAGAPKLSKIGNLIRAAGEKNKTPGAKPEEEKVASPPDLLSPPSRSIPQGKEREFNLDM